MLWFAVVLLCCLQHVGPGHQQSHGYLTVVHERFDGSFVRGLCFMANHVCLFSLLVASFWEGIMLTQAMAHRLCVGRQLIVSSNSLTGTIPDGLSAAALTYVIPTGALAQQSLHGLGFL